MTNRVVQKSKVPRQAAMTATWGLGTVRARGDDETRGETKKPKLKSLNPCNVEVQSMESTLIVYDPTFVVTSSQQPGETRQVLQTRQHARMRFSIAYDARAVATNSAAVLSTLAARKIVKKISTGGPFPCGAVESEATGHDDEAAVNDGMKTHLGIDDMQLFVCAVIDKSLADEYLEEVNECADKCHEPEKHDGLAWDDLKSCILDPARVREARRADLRVLPEDVSVQEGTLPEVKARDREDTDQGLVD